MLAVPLHGSDVAPRFCSADRFLIAELDRGQILHVRRLTFPEEAWSKRLERLSTAGVKVLLCGGFNRGFVPFAEGLGIRVISGLAGEAEQVIDAFLRDEIEQYRFLPCGTGRRERHRAGWPRRGHERALRELRGRRGVEPCRDTTEPVRREPDPARDGAAAVATGQTTEPDSQ